VVVEAVNGGDEVGGGKEVSKNKVNVAREDEERTRRFSV
jgi:hypothetical protein